jgi:hypothetical protein
LQIKAQGLLNAARWIEEEYGRETHGEVLQACSAPLCDRYTSVIAIDWHPVGEFAAWIARPEALMKRAAGLWRQFNDEGEMELKELGESLARFELRGVPSIDPMFCAVINGWCREVALAVGAVAPQSKHVSCVSRGEALCAWELRFARTVPTAGRGLAAERG